MGMISKEERKSGREAQAHTAACPHSSSIVLQLLDVDLPLLERVKVCAAPALIFSFTFHGERKPRVYEAGVAHTVDHKRDVLYTIALLF